ncbi:MAG: L,D-transpeptidase [Candidatus Polarisedimenticolaceae bacterium]|nr:L,D-transpeptidase [Candidatus Polarisedimenticolaceae bacterium]
MPARIEINLAQQQLRLLDAERVLASYAISSALNGPGEAMGSGCTPRGRHRIRIAIGDGCANNTVFIGRRETGEIYSKTLAAQHPERDWVLSRILWLTGCEPGINRGDQVDSLRRYIYIHGTPDSEPMGQPRSHGCIRMRNSDLITLFDQVGRGTVVEIIDA